LEEGGAVDVRAPKSTVNVVTFPADDAVFAQRVDDWLDAVGRAPDQWDAGDLEAALRRVHPHVATRWRNQIAGFGDRTLYVFRDGTVTASNDSDGWTGIDATARVVTNETGDYLDANEAAEALFGVSRDRIIGAHAGSFTETDARIVDADALWRALNATGRLHSLALVCRPDGSTVSVEFITVRDGDGPRRNVTYLRAIE
jgi:PAS domain S-box-containing protein